MRTSLHRTEGTARPRSEFTDPMRGSTATEGWPPPTRLPVQAYPFHSFTGGEIFQGATAKFANPYQPV